MEFLKRHYEKLVLAVLLLLFIGSMVYLLQIVQETAKINREGLTLPTRDPDFTPVSPTAEQFDRAKLFAFGNDWTPAVARNEKHKNYFSDLVVTFGAARCGHCERIIPLYFFENRECPLCGKKLVPPPKVEGPEVVLGRGTPEDPDGCGIPHAVKEKFGLDVNDPGNVLDDLDGDGFSNLYEYKQKTLMNEPRSRPPLWHRLVLVNIDKIKLPFMLMKVNTNNSEDKSTWDVQINRTDTSKTLFTSLNDIVKIDNRDYRVAEIKLNHTKRDVGGSEVIDDKSEIVLELLGGNTKIFMQVGKDVFSPEPKAFVKDIGDNRELTLDIEQEFTLGNRRTGMSRYRVKSIDLKTNEMVLTERSGRNRGKDVPEPITKAGKIPLNERVRVRNAEQDMMMMGMDPMMR